MSNFFKVSIESKAVIGLLEGAILNRHFVRFYYKSGNGNEGFRIIPPYMMIPRKGILELVGVPKEELKRGGKPRHYSISQLAERLKSKQLEVLPETFENPGVSRNKVVFTETPPVYRFIYDDEDVKKVKAGWLKIKYVK
jgi:hypothetical protein